MTPERHRRAKELFLRACELAPGQRPTFLDRACGGDAELRALVDALLAHHREPESQAGERTTTRAPSGEPAARLAAGQLVDGKYVVEARLGAGAMGEVYRARQLALDRAVAIKVLARDAHPDARRRFEREARAVARLRHPHVVTVHDLGVAAEVGPYLVMEYVEGRTLRDELRRRTALPVAEAVALVRQACAGTAAAHAAGVIHRDLKPENILLEGEGGRARAKVADFGIARLAGAGGAGAESLTQTGAVVGTAHYMSPEQCRGEAADARSDVYALGCVLYEVLAGRPPFTAETVLGVLEKHRRQAPAALGALRPEVPAALEGVVARALAKGRGRRWQSAAELGDALAGVARGDAVGEAGAVDTFEPEGAPAPPGNLPRPLTRFIGREAQIREVRRLLAQHRLVTLTGPGGIGKTRLAVEVARESLSAYPDGVWLVELAALADAALVPKAIARALGVCEEPGRTLEETLIERLKPKHLLVLLDNCEHLVETCAHLTAALLRACPALRVLATSREALALVGEAIWPVPTLSVPDPDHPPGLEQLAECEATALFLDRAALSKPGFAATERNAVALFELARRLDGIPLAIELAAARVKLLSPAALLARLEQQLKLLVGGARDLPVRQQTMRDAISWSYDLLEEPEQGLLRRLAVFAGGCTLEAAEAVCGTGELEVLDGLGSLLDKSLLRQRDEADGEARFLMLEVVRAFARERLEARGEGEAARRAHARYFLGLAREAEPELVGARQAEWLARLEAEHENLRAALGWLLEHDPDACLGLAVAVRQLWIRHGHHTEGRQWLQAALERSRTAPVPVRERAIAGAGNLARQQGELTVARGYFEEHLRIGRETNDARVIGWASLSLGTVATQQGDLRTARPYLEESLARGCELREDRLIGNATNVLGEIAREEGAWARARELYGQALALHRQAGSQAGVNTALSNLGAVAYEAGDLEAAGAAYRDALAIAQALGDREGISYCLDGLAAVAAGHGAWARAARLGGAAEALRGAIGAPLERLDQRLHDGWVARLREALDPGELEREWARGRAMRFEAAVEEALDVRSR